MLKLSTVTNMNYLDLDKSEVFVWKKKYEQEGIFDEKLMLKECLRQVEENKEELKKLKERQQKRELERQQILNDNEFMQRQKETERYQHWEQQEDTFLLRQHRQRSRIRIRDNMAKPIDLFSHYIDIFGAKLVDNSSKNPFLAEEEVDISDCHTELLNPCEWFNGLRQEDLEDLIPDIEFYLSADCKENLQYWEDLQEIAKNELEKLIAAKNKTKSGESDGINSVVLKDVMAQLEVNSIAELNELEQLLSSENNGMDYSFCKSALSRLRAQRARLRLTSAFKRNLENYSEIMLELTKGKALKNESDRTDCSKMDVNQIENEDGTDKNSNSKNSDQSDDEDKDSEVEEGATGDKFNEDRLRCMKLYKEGRYSPKKFELSELDSSISCLNYEDEFDLLVKQRNKICNATSLDDVKMATMSGEESNFVAQASKGMDRSVEGEFNRDEPVHMNYSWSNKYKIRKPRYFNRVHTGFEWNKYNQTHYDIDNPPPKVVQGYKFNIFYPDLIDKTKTPKFSLTPCSDDKNFSIIRFSAGPPYADIAFRIVNREWNNSHKSGYRCQFMNSILQLWFQFKRDRYRR